MLKIEETNLWGWDGAIRGMRNPMNSWSKSDSDNSVYIESTGNGRALAKANLVIGENDMTLMKALIRGGGDERKFLRMIHVQADVTAPLYWWKEADTYKIGTVANSCSTMHKIQSEPFTLANFSHEHLSEPMLISLQNLILDLEEARKEHNTRVARAKEYRKEGELDKARFETLRAKDWWWQMIQLLPSSYNQKRTLDLNYEVLFRIYPKRKNHKLDEWHTFCDWIENLPYMKEFLEAMN